jgi:hypothetical protein
MTMVQFQVDPDSLIAAGTVAERQAGHLGRTADYVGDVCSNTGAFSGVLQIFLGSYQETLEHARTGLTQSQRVAHRVHEALDACSEAYVDVDHSVYRVFEKTFADQVDLPPYVAPGGGATTPGGPTSSPPGATVPGEDEPFGLAKLPEWLNGPVDRLVPGEDTKLPAWLDLKGATQREIVQELHTRGDRAEWLRLRAEGYTPEQAYSMVRLNVDTVSDSHVYATMQERAHDAYQSTYQDSLSSGMSEQDARDAASDAASRQHHDDAVDHQGRRDALDAAGTYKGAYDQVSGLVHNVNDLVEHTEQLGETRDDLGEYDEFEDGPRDTSAQDWATR